MQRPRVIAATVVALAVVGLTGCAPAGPELPTLETTHPADPVPADLEAVAKAYYDCMTEAKIPVTFLSNQPGGLIVVSFGPGHTYLYTDGDEGVGNQGYDDPNDPALQNLDDFAKTHPEPTLLVDGVDHSEDYAACLAQTGYSESAAWEAQQPDPAVIAHQVAVNNQWAACVRENGWPEAKDSSLPAADDGMGLPPLYLTPTITEDQLRQLVDACPFTDLDVTPVIVIGMGDDTPAPTSPAEQAEFDRIRHLQNVVLPELAAQSRERTGG
ncbi:MAG: hypothetical protein LBI33_12300 [Propionibacteriaceae bacterium]|jgi:hypothetical protein|nr:hypothetical protein [Propionibacteriaceae bacterium]